jgi:HrpA-like RNA helicase
LPAHSVPEILRVPLERLVLQVKAMMSISGVASVTDILQKCPDPPTLGAIAAAERNLLSLQALTSDGNISPLGLHLATLPCDPKLSKLLIYGALLSCCYSTSAVAACLSTRGIFSSSPDMRSIVDSAKVSFLRIVSPNSKDLKSDYLIYIAAIRKFDESQDKRKLVVAF